MALDGNLMLKGELSVRVIKHGPVARLFNATRRNRTLAHHEQIHLTRKLMKNV